MRITQTQILDCRSDVEKLVTANLLEDPPDDIVVSASRIWTKYKNRSGITAEHSHWNWEDKLSYAHNANSAFRTYAIECEQSIQGLILLNVGWQHTCYLPEQQGKRLVYVHYVETAPWNSLDSIHSKFRRNGTRLIQAAIQFSIEMGYNGRVGLHSLPSAEPYYIYKVGMSQIQRAAMQDDLNYYELSEHQAKIFLGEF